MKAKFVNESNNPYPDPYSFTIRRNKEGERMVFNLDNTIGGMINEVGTMVLSFQTSYGKDDFKNYCKYNGIKCSKFFGSDDIVVVNSKDFPVTDTTKKLGESNNECSNIQSVYETVTTREKALAYAKYKNVEYAGKIGGFHKFYHKGGDIAFILTTKLLNKNYDLINEAIQEPFSNSTRNQPIRGSYPLSKIQYEDADKKLSKEEINDLDNWEKHCYLYKNDPKYRKAWDKSVQDIENDAYEIGMSNADESESYLKEYYDSESDELSKIKMEARRISKEEGVTQHVNAKGNHYEISDWYDDENTVASYENGVQL